MLVARAYCIDPRTGDISGFPSAVLFGYSEKLLRRKLEKRQGVKKVTVKTLDSRCEETVIAEGLVTVR